MKIPTYQIDSLFGDDDAFLSAVVASAANAAALSVYEDNYPLPVSYDEVSPSGARFRIPLVLPVDHESGDSRSFLSESLSSRQFPLALMWQPKTGTGHDGSYIVGRIDGVEVGPDGLKNAFGVFDVGPWGREAQRLVEGGFLRGISADLDKFEGEIAPEPEEDIDDAEDVTRPTPIRNKKISVKQARLSGITLVAKPAFEECYIMIDNESTPGAEVPIADGVYEDDWTEEFGVTDAFSAITASAAPLIPPRDWFKNPNLGELTPLTITDDGRVYGHIASWRMAHIGLPHKKTNPPRSASNYAYFTTGALRTDDGSDVNVGQLTLSGGHAPLSASAADAAKHYDDTQSAVADVTAGEDQFGIWVSGALRPDVTPSQVRAFRASAPSGDWRPINGRLELVAVCAVNVPGFPVARSLVAGGQVHALVAAGAFAQHVEAVPSGDDEFDASLAELSAIRAERAEDFEALVASARAEIFGEPEEDFDAIVASARAEIESLRPAEDFDAVVASARAAIFED